MTIPNTSTPSTLNCVKVTVKLDGHTKSILQNVSIRAKSGEIHAVIGESGAGKSTLLNVLAGFQDVSSGKVLLDNKTLSAPDHPTIKAANRSISYVFQQPTLFPHLTLSENISFGVRNASKVQKEQIAQHWLDQFGLVGRAKSYPHEISGGEAQRVAIARALAAAPKAILLDEPFSNLNADLRAEMQSQVFESIRKTNIPCIWVTHAPQEALQFANAITVLHNGLALQTGTPLDLYRQPRHAKVLTAISDINIIPAEDWPSRLLGIASNTNSGTLAVRTENFYPDEKGDVFKVLQKRLKGDRIALVLSHEKLTFNASIGTQYWDNIVIGQETRFSVSPFSVFKFPD